MHVLLLVIPLLHTTKATTSLATTLHPSFIFFEIFSSTLSSTTVATSQPLQSEKQMGRSTVPPSAGHVHNSRSSIEKRSMECGNVPLPGAPTRSYDPEGTRHPVAFRTWWNVSMRKLGHLRRKRAWRRLLVNEHFSLVLFYLYLDILRKTVPSSAAQRRKPGPRKE